jgi:hypothetical protein
MASSGTPQTVNRNHKTPFSIGKQLLRGHRQEIAIDSKKPFFYASNNHRSAEHQRALKPRSARVSTT